MDSRVVHMFPKNDSEEIRFSLREFKERQYLDIRLFFQAPDRDEMCPSKKGITLGVEFLPEVIRGFVKLEEELRNSLSSSAREGYPLQTEKLEDKIG